MDHCQGDFRQFDIEHCKAINTLSYILSEVGKLFVK